MSKERLLHLTEDHKDDKILVNPKHIVLAQKNYHPWTEEQYTEIWLEGGRQIWVKEDVETIRLRIQN